MVSGVEAYTLYQKSHKTHSLSLLPSACGSNTVNRGVENDGRASTLDLCLSPTQANGARHGELTSSYLTSVVLSFFPCGLILLHG